MSQESLFKIAVLVIIMSFAGAFIYFQRRAGVRRNLFTEAKVQSEHEVKLVLIIRGICGIIWYISIGAWFFNIGLPGTIALPIWVRWLGLVPGVVAIVMNAISQATLYQHQDEGFEPGIRTRAGKVLVTRGIYRWLQHPLYVSFVLMLSAVGLLTSNWVIGVSGLTMITAVLLFRIPVEEQNLENAFGDAYRSYQKGTGRFLPFVGF